MNHIIKRILNKKLTVEVYSNSTVKYRLLQWGATYRSRTNSTSFEDYRRFIFFFKDSPVNVESYDIVTSTVDVFPIKWTISGSHDNKTWTIIDSKNESLCSPENYVSRDNGIKDFCSVVEVKHYSLTYPNREYYQYIMFHLLNNSFYPESSIWKDTFVINGFELNGDFFMSMRKLVTCHCTSSNLVITPILILLISKK
jgi:hypothetical protein